MVGGFDISQKPGLARQRIGFCPQYDALWPHLTVAETLLVAAAMKCVRSPRSIAADMCEKLGLTAKANTFASDLSGGQKRKLCVGCAFMGKESLLWMLPY